MSELAVRNVVSPDGGVADNLKPVTASAWVNFDGTTSTIRDSHNVIAITDVSTGRFNINLEMALDVAVSANFTCSNGLTSSKAVNSQATIIDASTIGVLSYDTVLGTEVDVSYNSVQVFGGQS